MKTTFVNPRTGSVTTTDTNAHSVHYTPGRRPNVYFISYAINGGATWTANVSGFSAEDALETFLVVEDMMKKPDAVKVIDVTRVARTRPEAKTAPKSDDAGLDGDLLF